MTLVSKFRAYWSDTAVGQFRDSATSQWIWQDPDIDADTSWFWQTAQDSSASLSRFTQNYITWSRTTNRRPYICKGKYLGNYLNLLCRWGYRDFRVRVVDAMWLHLTHVSNIATRRRRPLMGFSERERVMERSGFFFVFCFCF